MMRKQDLLGNGSASRSRSNFQARSGPVRSLPVGQSAFWPLDGPTGRQRSCTGLRTGPARANLDVLSLLLRRITPGLMILIASIVIFSTALVRADDPNKVGLVVVHGDDSVVKQCIEISENEINGLELLERSGLDLSYELSGGMGGFVCRIDNEGCQYPQEPCDCQCRGSTCTFWSYWILVDSTWKFSGLGASSYKVKDGDVQGWVWGEGSPGGGGTSPPVVTFKEICGRSPKKDTVTPTPTHTPTPTGTPTPTATSTPTNTSVPPTTTPVSTNTPKPTDTPEPEPTPIIHHFTADRTTINAGESVLLSWDLSEAEAAYLRYDGYEEGVISPGSKTVSPTKTTVYTLVARNDGGEAIVEVTITVNGSPPAPTSTPTLLPTATPDLPVQTAGASVPPAEPLVSEPVISFNAGAPTVPPGACTSLYWDVQNAGTIYLDEVEVSPQAAQEVCPAQSQTYTLRVVYPGGERTAQLALEVADTIAAPAAGTPTLMATATVTVKPTAPPAQPPAGATLVSQIEVRPIKRSVVSPQPSSGEWTGWSLAKLGIWGGLIGGWCLIATVALIGWGAFWWLNSKSKR